MADTKIGKITHYYDKIGVAVLNVTDNPLKTGETIKITDKNGEEKFTQEVSSMQVEHQQIKEAKKGDDVGLKTDQEVKEGDVVFKVK
ncbi:hypothetical protein COT63_02040 [Candidatus Shapirobacteria bacterium CG09_land_8_20_14_0_10_38_17]|uniref:Translation elongation factor-like protein n=1 Tax=Candidatus Shapirobacteria bacterium CG09_land_8_20_14_0_10_38_17 TaxID=1974884 RepID=A0A2H0WQV6_9BACT|nr:MAG: hypothetical protein COT63_02040 [Candidatus Shapirobacteria bacterium CG09_land_8_20_14_0_10_38_17]